MKHFFCGVKNGVMLANVAVGNRDCQAVSSVVTCPGSTNLGLQR